MGSGIVPVPATSSQPQSEDNAKVCSSSLAMERHGDFDSGYTAAGGVIPDHHDNGRVLVRVGSNSDGQSSEWHMGSELVSSSHKYLRFVGGVPGSETFSAVSSGTTCVDKNGQFHGGGTATQTGTRLLSLLATLVPGVLSRGANLLSQGNPLYGEWTLHPQVVEQIWQRFGQADVDLFASQENIQCPLYFAPLGVDALAHSWPRVLLYAFPPLSLISPTLARARDQGLSLILVAPRWPSNHWVAEIIQTQIIPS